MKRKADKKRGEAIEDTEGDLVWVEGSNINSDRPAKKLAFRRAGPFPVIKKVGSSAYKLIIPKMWKSLQRVKIEALPLPNLRAATGVLANSHRPKSRGSHTKSWKNLKLQKTGRQSTVPCQVAGPTIWRINLGGQTRDHQGDLTAMSGFSQGPPGRTQDPYNSHTREIIQQSRGDATLGGG